MIEAIRQSRYNATVANSDPLFVFAELLVKINRREKVVKEVKEVEDDEDSQRSADSAD